MKTILLLGSGELGKEFTISAKRLGQRVVAVDKYPEAPAMQVADTSEVVSMLDGEQLQKVVDKHQPDIIVPEVESIRTEMLQKFERSGIFVVPTAEATHLTMNRDAIRDLVANDLHVPTARFEYATTKEELFVACENVGFPCVVKPVMSSSGKGQSVASSLKDVTISWQVACQGMRGDQQKVIVEEFIKFETEITLLTIKQKEGPTLFVDPIGHRQEGGDYRESWIPANLRPPLLAKAKRIAKKVTDRLGGAGLFGVEFFITKDDVIFSELSPRPHDTGMVTLISQDLSEFDLHCRAVLGLPIPVINYRGPAASVVVLASRESNNFKIIGLEKALQIKNTDVRVFGKPSTRKNRRMAIVLARDTNTMKARRRARRAAEQIKICYSP
jgi:phosphoribosylglycinamide formyltransferase 2